MGHSKQWKNSTKNSEREQKKGEKKTVNEKPANIQERRRTQTHLQITLRFMRNTFHMWQWRPLKTHLKSNNFLIVVAVNRQTHAYTQKYTCYPSLA